MKKVTYKPLLTTSLSIRTISSFQLNTLYIWNISGSNFYLIVLTCKNTTCKLESKSKEIQLYDFKIDLKFSTSSLKNYEIRTPEKNDLDFIVEWLLYNRFIHFPETESDFFPCIVFSMQLWAKSWWEHLSIEKKTVKIDTKIFSETI